MLAHGAKRDLLEPPKAASPDLLAEDAARTSALVRWLADICELGQAFYGRPGSLCVCNTELEGEPLEWFLDTLPADMLCTVFTYKSLSSSATGSFQQLRSSHPSKKPARERSLLERLQEVRQPRQTRGGSERYKEQLSQREAELLQNARRAMGWTELAHDTFPVSWTAGPFVVSWVDLCITRVNIAPSEPPSSPSSEDSEEPLWLKRMAGAFALGPVPHVLRPALDSSAQQAFDSTGAGYWLLHWKGMVPRATADEHATCHATHISAALSHHHNLPQPKKTLCI